MPTVYAIQRKAHRDPTTKQWVQADLTPAEHFGTVKVILPPGNLPRDPAVGLRQLVEGLKDFDPAEDLLLLAGDPVAIAMASSIVAQRCGGRLRLLKWDRMHQCYLLYEAQIWNDGNATPH